VTGANLRTLKGLMDKSLLQRTPDGRYQIHELLRQYAADKLGRSPAALNAARDRHCAYYADFLHERLEDVNNGGQAEATQDIATELGNVQAAWRWAVKQRKAQEIHKSAGTFVLFFQIQSRFLEGAEAFGQAARSLEAEKPGEQRDLTLAYVLVFQGWLCLRLGQLGEAKEAFEKSRAIYHRLGDPFPSGMGTDPRTALGTLSIILGDYAKAARLGEQALLASEARGDKWNLVFSHYVLGNVAMAQGKFQAARRSARQAYTITKSLNERWFRAYILNDLGSVARALGDFEEAKRYYEASYAIQEEFDTREGMGLALNHLGEIALLQEDYAQAEGLYRQSLAMYEEIGDKGGLATALKGLGDVALAAGEMRTARQPLQRALQIATEIQFISLRLSARPNCRRMRSQMPLNERYSNALIQL
jgi:tetratricopeptide (TPR) repeat protein